MTKECQDCCGGGPFHWGLHVLLHLSMAIDKRDRALCFLSLACTRSLPLVPRRRLWRPRPGHARLCATTVRGPRPPEPRLTHLQRRRLPARDRDSDQAAYWLQDLRLPVSLLVETEG